MIGCTGEIAFTVNDFLRFSRNTYLTGIATKDLSQLESLGQNCKVFEIPGIGFEYRIRDGLVFTQLGNGRSINLYRSESIPNRASDMFRSAVLLSTANLVDRYKGLRGGIYLEEVNELIESSDLYERYYDLYFGSADVIN